MAACGSVPGGRLVERDFRIAPGLRATRNLRWMDHCTSSVTAPTVLGGNKCSDEAKKGRSPHIELIAESKFPHNDGRIEAPKSKFPLEVQVVLFCPFVQFRCPSPQSTMNRDRQSPSRNLRGSRSFRLCSLCEIPSEITRRVPSLVLAVHQSRESRVFTPFAFGRMRKQRFCGSTGAPTPALPSTCALFG